MLRRKRPAGRVRKRLSPWALLLLASLLAGLIVYLTWPARAAVSCEQLPELTALAICAATLFVFCIRTFAVQDTTRDRLVPSGAAILAALAFFLSVHYVALYRKPCVAVQHHLHGR